MRKIQLLVGLIIAIILATAFYVQLLQKKSYAYLYLDGDNLTMNLNINASDEANFEEFLANINAPTSRQLKLQLDQASIDYLGKMLPMRTYLSFTPRSVKFSSGKILTLQSAVDGGQYHFATSSASLDLASADPWDFDLKVASPAALVKYASSSSQLYLSPKILGLFPILQKIDTIVLRVQGKSVDGEIDLR